MMFELVLDPFSKNIQMNTLLSTYTKGLITQFIGLLIISIVMLLVMRTQHCDVSPTLAPAFDAAN